MTDRPTVVCQMTDTCTEPVACLDEKGYVYCGAHGKQRKSSGIRCRRLAKLELTALFLHGSLPAYRRNEQREAETQLGLDLAKKAAERIGRGWDLLGEAIQEALVAKEIVNTLLAQSTANASDDVKVLQRIALTALRC